MPHPSDALIDNIVERVSWSSRRSSDVARLISRCVADICHYTWRRKRSGRVGCSGRWCICSSFLTSLMVQCIWFQGNMGMSPGRRATITCALLLAAGLFIDLHSLCEDGDSLNLTIVKDQRLLLRHALWRY